MFTMLVLSSAGVGVLPPQPPFTSTPSAPIFDTFESATTLYELSATLSWPHRNGDHLRAE
jgi:hypothetical protein